MNFFRIFKIIFNWFKQHQKQKQELLKNTSKRIEPKQLFKNFSFLVFVLLLPLLLLRNKNKVQINKKIENIECLDIYIVFFLFNIPNFEEAYYFDLWLRCSKAIIVRIKFIYVYKISVKPAWWIWYQYHTHIY